MNPTNISPAKRYLSAIELRRMRLSPSSPLLAAVVAALPEPLSLWTAEDWGVDEQGFYELVITSGPCQGAEYLPGNQPGRETRSLFFSHCGS